MLEKAGGVKTCRIQ